MAKAAMARVLVFLAMAALLSPLSVCRCIHAGPCAGEGEACGQEAAPRGERPCCHHESREPDGGQKDTAPQGGCGCAKISTPATPLVVEPVLSPMPPSLDVVVPLRSGDPLRTGPSPAFSALSFFDTGPPDRCPVFILNCSFLI